VWEEAWGGLRRVFAGLFHRADALAVALGFVLALVVDQARKNCWTLAELAGHAGPGRFQHLLARARWSAADAKAALRDYAAESLGSDGAVGAWVAGDEVYGADPALRRMLEERGGGRRLGSGQLDGAGQDDRVLAAEVLGLGEAENHALHLHRPG
jgi:hypothetical protein